MKNIIGKFSWGVLCPQIIEFLIFPQNSPWPVAYPEIWFEAVQKGWIDDFPLVVQGL